MSPKAFIICLLSSCLLIHQGHAHLNYPTSRDFGIFTGTAAEVVVKTGQSTKAFGWADGTDEDFAHQDDQRYFKFTLQNTASVTISVTALNAAVFLPGFSLYAGVGHAATDAAHPDHDGAQVTIDYLASLPGPAREGAFDALHTFQIGNSDDPNTNYIGNLVTLTYIDNAADGTAANYGNASGINGDGVADGYVTRTMTLPAGVYTLAIGGANYNNQTDMTAQGFTATVSVVPEPGSTLLVGLGVCALAARRRRRNG